MGALPAMQSLLNTQFGKAGGFQPFVNPPPPIALGGGHSLNLPPLDYGVNQLTDTIAAKNGVSSRIAAAAPQGESGVAGSVRAQQSAGAGAGWKLLT